MSIWFFYQLISFTLEKYNLHSRTRCQGISWQRAVQKNKGQKFLLEEEYLQLYQKVGRGYLLTRRLKQFPKILPWTQNNIKKECKLNRGIYFLNFALQNTNKFVEYYAVALKKSQITLVIKIATIKRIKKIFKEKYWSANHYNSNSLLF